MSNENLITENPSDSLSAVEELRRREREPADFIENASVGLPG